MSKIRIKIGAVEVEYEGTDDFLRDELPLLLDKLATLGARVPDSNTGGGAAAPANNQANLGNGGSAGSADVGTCSTVAATIGAKTGPELAVAAGAKLIIGDGRSSFTRKELLNEMQSATAYYNKNYSSNLSKIINGLVKEKKFREVAKDTFALAANVIDELRARLAS